jgi:hypothetical protein
VKGGRQEKSEKELAALARLQNNYGFLLNPGRVAGQFEDSRGEKSTQEKQPKRDVGAPVQSASKDSSGKYIPPNWKQNPTREDTDRRKGADKRSRSRDRERTERGGGGAHTDRIPRDNRENRGGDRREREDRPRDRLRDRDVRRR